MKWALLTTLLIVLALSIAALLTPYLYPITIAIAIVAAVGLLVETILWAIPKKERGYRMTWSMDNVPPLPPVPEEIWPTNL